MIVGETRRVWLSIYHRAIGEYREPPVHEDAILFLSANKAMRRLPGQVS
jgi:hypothetical protein